MAQVSLGKGSKGSQGMENSPATCTCRSSSPAHSPASSPSTAGAHLPSAAHSPSCSGGSTPPTSRCGGPNTEGGRVPCGEEAAEETWLLTTLGTCARAETDTATGWLQLARAGRPRGVVTAGARRGNMFPGAVPWRMLGWTLQAQAQAQWRAHHSFVHSKLYSQRAQAGHLAGGQRALAGGGEAARDLGRLQPRPLDRLDLHARER